MGTGSEAGNVSIVESQQGEVVRSTLVIKKINNNQFGDYGCRVTNDIGEAFVTIKLKAVGECLLL